MPDFIALQAMTGLAMALRTRAAQGLYRVNEPPSSPYLKACRLVVPELGSSFLLAYYDLRPLQPPPECSYALTLATAAIPDAFMRATLLANPKMKQIDAPSRAQRLAAAVTIFGKDWVNAWWKTTQLNGEVSWHAYLFARPNTEKMKWEPVGQVPEAWPAQQGMRKLVEV